MVHIFIINPIAGQMPFANNLRLELSQIEDFEYFVFNTSGQGMESEQISKLEELFEDEDKIRIYCCGGTGTLGHIINGISNFDKVEVAYYPCGLTNNFIKFFKEDEQKFKDIRALIEGTAVPIDIIQTNHGRAINSMSIGLDSNIIHAQGFLKFLSILSAVAPFVISLAYAVYATGLNEYDIWIDGEHFELRSSQLFFGNGGVLGGVLYFAEDTDIQDGLAEYLIGPEKRGYALLPLLKAMKNKDMDQLKSKCRMGKCRSIKIKSRDNQPLRVNLDGEIYSDDAYWEAEILKGKLQFVIPQNVDDKVISRTKFKHMKRTMELVHKHIQGIKEEIDER